MGPRHLLTLVGVLAAGLLLASATTLDAQVVPEPPITQMDWQLGTVRASGQPVIPLFEGWYANPDGTYDLCFGFFNLNREEALDIPIGADNFIEPARFNGIQPTHFPALGVADPLRPGRMVREYCVFAVNVPEDIGSERVWWNLRIDGHTYRVPGHITAPPWRVDNLMNSVGTALMDFENGVAIKGVLTAPVVRFIEAPGSAGRGKGGVTAGPFTARVGTPLLLTISVSHPDEQTVSVEDLDPDEEGVLAEQSMKWSKFAGPVGTMGFSPQRSAFQVGPDPTEQTTEVTFSQAGDYVLLVQVLNGSFSSQCCWTNAYVNVTVTP